MNWNWNFAQPNNSQAAFDAAQAVVQNRRNNAYTQNMDNRQVGNANEMMSWMQQGNDAAAYQQAQVAAAEQQAQQLAQQQAQREAARQQRIKEIETEIAEIEQRMADRKKSMKRNEDISSARIAALEARKFFSQDPTSIWRWKQGMDAQKAQRAEDLERIEAEKQKNKAEQRLHVQNKLNSYLPTMAISLSTSPEQAQQYLNTLAGLETEANNYGIDDPRIAEMKARLSGDLPYNQMMAAIDELEDIDANFGKGPDYDRMSDAQKFEVYKKKLEDAKNDIIANYPELWRLMDRDRRYSKKLATLLANRRPKSKGTPPARPSTKRK